MGSMNTPTHARVVKYSQFIKEVVSMAGPERKSYRSAAPTPPAEPEEEVYEDEEVQEETPPVRRATPTRAVSVSRGTAPSRTPSRPSGGGNYGRGGQSQDGTYVTVTGLFPTKSGKADTAFVKDDMYELLQGIKPGDTIGVSMNQKTNRLQFWYITKG